MRAKRATYSVFACMLVSIIVKFVLQRIQFWKKIISSAPFTHPLK